MKVSVSVGLDMPKTRCAKEEGKLSIEERVRDAIDMVESGHESRRDWEFLRRLNNAIMKKYNCGKCNERMLNILMTLQPIMEKYGQYDHEGVIQAPELHSTVTGVRRR